MPVINGYKYSCAPCIRGHRATSCNHTDRVLIEVRKPGRPLETCGHQLDTCSCGRLQEVLGGVPLDSNQLPNLIPQTKAISPGPPQRPKAKAKPRTKADSKIDKRISKNSSGVHSASESPALVSSSSASYTLSPTLPIQPQISPQSQAPPQPQMWTPMPNSLPATVEQNTFVPYQPHQRVDQRAPYQGVQEYGVQSIIEDIVIPGKADGKKGVGQGGQMFIRSQYFSMGQDEGSGSAP